MEVTVGKIYAVDHRRKGLFSIRVSEFDDQVVGGVIVQGNVPGQSKEPLTTGDYIKVYKRLCHFTQLD